MKETIIKRNTLRFFYPEEWWKFTGVITNLYHLFIFEFLLNTGLRIQEARTLRIKNINLERKFLTILKSKTGKQRQVFFSTQFKSKLQQYILTNKLQLDDTLKIPSVQFLDRRIKEYCKRAGISNPEEFSCHSFRRTHENYLLVKNINSMVVTMQLGHSINVATQYYISQFMKPEEKNQIKSIIGDLFDSL